MIGAGLSATWIAAPPSRRLRRARPPTQASPAIDRSTTAKGGPPGASAVPRAGGAGAEASAGTGRCGVTTRWGSAAVKADGTSSLLVAGAGAGIAGGAAKADSGTGAAADGVATGCAFATGAGAGTPPTGTCLFGSVRSGRNATRTGTGRTTRPPGAPSLPSTGAAARAASGAEAGVGAAAAARAAAGAGAASAVAADTGAGAEGAGVGSAEGAAGGAAGADGCCDGLGVAGLCAAGRVGSRPSGSR
jgi:hypothetical protein